MLLFCVLYVSENGPSLAADIFNIKLIAFTVEILGKTIILGHVMTLYETDSERDKHKKMVIDKDIMPISYNTGGHYGLKSPIYLLNIC